MYSKLDPVLQTLLPRQTQGTDTRMGIQREDKTGDENRKNKHDKEEETAELWEDSTVVSVRALGALLASLVKSAEGNASHADISVSTPPPGPQPPAALATQNTDSAKAARAYKAMYYTGQKMHQPPLPAAPAGSAAGALTAEEERAIHKLLTDIAVLTARGIETLEIRKSDSFLRSLADAAALALKS